MRSRLELSTAAAYLDVGPPAALGAARSLAGQAGASVPRAVENRSLASLAMERYAEGDGAAFAVVYDEIAPRIHRYLLRLARNPDVAADLLQQTFLKIHEARGRFTRGASVEPWAYAIARRLFIDSTRRRRELVPLEDESSLHNADDIEGAVRANELSRALLAALDQLPAAQREAFLLVRYEQLSLAEAAAVLGVTVPAVKLRAHRAYAALREKLGEFSPTRDAALSEQLEGLGPAGESR